MPGIFIENMKTLTEKIRLVDLREKKLRNATN